MIAQFFGLLYLFSMVSADATQTWKEECVQREVDRLRKEGQTTLAINYQGDYPFVMPNIHHSSKYIELITHAEYDPNAAECSTLKYRKMFKCTEFRFRVYGEPFTLIAAYWISPNSGSINDRTIMNNGEDYSICYPGWSFNKRVEQPCIRSSFYFTAPVYKEVLKECELATGIFLIASRAREWQCADDLSKEMKELHKDFGGVAVLEERPHVHTSPFITFANHELYYNPKDDKQSPCRLLAYQVKHRDLSGCGILRIFYIDKYDSIIYGFKIEKNPGYPSNFKRISTDPGWMQCYPGKDFDPRKWRNCNGTGIHSWDDLRVYIYPEDHEMLPQFLFLLCLFTLANGEIRGGKKEQCVQKTINKLRNQGYTTLPIDYSHDTPVIMKMQAGVSKYIEMTAHKAYDVIEPECRAVKGDKYQCAKFHFRVLGVPYSLIVSWRHQSTALDNRPGFAVCYKTWFFEVRQEQSCIRDDFMFVPVYPERCDVAKWTFIAAAKMDKYYCAQALMDWMNTGVHNNKDVGIIVDISSQANVISTNNMERGVKFVGQECYYRPSLDPNSPCRLLAYQVEKGDLLGCCHLKFILYDQPYSLLYGFKEEKIAENGKSFKRISTERAWMQCQPGNEFNPAKWFDCYGIGAMDELRIYRYFADSECSRVTTLLGIGTRKKFSPFADG